MLDKVTAAPNAPAGAAMTEGDRASDRRTVAEEEISPPRAGPAPDPDDWEVAVISPPAGEVVQRRPGNRRPPDGSCFGSGDPGAHGSPRVGDRRGRWAREDDEDEEGRTHMAARSTKTSALDLFHPGGNACRRAPIAGRDVEQLATASRPPPAAARSHGFSPGDKMAGKNHPFRVVVVVNFRRWRRLSASPFMATDGGKLGTSPVAAS